MLHPNVPDKIRKSQINEVLLLCQTIGQITKKWKPEVDGKLRSCLWSLSAGGRLLAVLTDNRVGSRSTVSVPPGKRVHLSGTWEQLGGSSQWLGTGKRYSVSTAYRRGGEVCLKHPWWEAWVVKVQVLQHLDVGDRPVGLLSLGALRA